MYEGEFDRSRLGGTPKRLSASEPKELILPAQTFAKVLAGFGWIVLPPQGTTKEVVSLSTINLTGNFPRGKNLSLHVIFDKLGIKNAEDWEKGSGKTIWHFLFGAMKYCICVAEMLVRYFRESNKMDRLPGNHQKAMSQKVQHGFQPEGWSAVHILCQAPDSAFKTNKLVKQLLASGVLTKVDFDLLVDNNVSVFFVLQRLLASYVLASPLPAPLHLHLRPAPLHSQVPAHPPSCYLLR